jgi:hypothetical protein
MTGNNIKDALLIIGGISGLLAFLWKIYDSVWATFLSHLTIDLQLEKQKNDNRQIFKVTTSVENKGVVSKKIAFAFVLIYTDQLGINSVLNTLTGHNSTSFNYLLYELMTQPEMQQRQVVGKNIVFYPIPYYYTQGSVGNEKLKFAFAQDFKELEENKTYSVMFTIVSKPMFGLFVRYRLLHDTILI